MEQTAVEILIEKYNKQWEKYGIGSSISYSELIADLKQLKEIEKEKIKKYWIDGKEDTNYGHHIFLDAEKYYNKTFKKE